jgi:cytochrome c oxidase cbb3-type subunit III
MRRLIALVLVGLALSGCEREQRQPTAERARASEREAVALTVLSPGQGAPVATHSDTGERYLGNAYDLSEGKRLFSWFNCTGCHGNGGGGSGPALMDGQWIYGGRIENIVATIREGRPNGMPSFRGKIPDDEIWQIAAFVLSLSGNVPKSAAPSRDDHLSAHPAENALPTVPPVLSGRPQ